MVNIALIIVVILNVLLILSVTLLIIGRLIENYIDNFDIIDKYILGLSLCDIVAIVTLVILIKCS